MNKYDFVNAPDRSTTDSVKWHVKKGDLPMSIADMDFKTAPEIIAAMKEKISLGVFGYEWPEDDYFNAVADWYEKEHGHRPEQEWLIFTTGVVPAISAVVRRISHIGDNVLVQAPVYNVFYNSIENNGRHVLSNDLQFDGSNYKINWEDLEQKLALPLTTLMIFCNPHNPVGKVWTQAEVQKIADLCFKHHVVLLSDEIHGDLVRKGPDYTPAFSVNGPARDNVISLVSPSKTFNVAALHAATAIVPNNNLRAMVNRGLNSDEIAEPNLLAIPGTIAAYEHGHDWLQALIKQLNVNFTYAQEFIGNNLPQVKVVSGKATYLIWLDVEQISTDSQELAEYLEKKTGLVLSPGSIYRGNGHNFLRMNLACPLAMVKDGLERLKTGLTQYSA
ncbi:MULTISPECIES: MalY/PatB family protein [unclassified Lactobacillus]|uniref:MalY/PatB family protein n=1 Tax=unclassified Lactobacillus TaxID=2620435 RepID=UPI0018DC8BE4|nr:MULTISPECIES: MalY/PatB family protein [unclassified Lactobacillus]MBH9990121.1 pyridoxal phosphate-dependent aminotransferase [Lactobacillus sp. M0392]MBI0024548.1 pyridoxal phosphate-dependent aminotransferase [Lactobacillus sp. W8171]MBI0045191.1 pyridoxal phosphate-dependent aminotransferase [Lactobacillus sp. M0393]